MTGIHVDRTEAERLWRTADRPEDRLDLVERALAAVGRGPSRRAGAHEAEDAR